MSRRECYVCRKEGAPARMIGGYYASLCLACQNRFHIFLMEHPMYGNYMDALAEVRWAELTATGGGVAACRNYRKKVKDVSALEKELYHVSEGWVLQEREKAIRRNEGGLR